MAQISLPALLKAELKIGRLDWQCFDLRSRILRKKNGGPGRT
jgi:hypothetical protein